MTTAYPAPNWSERIGVEERQAQIRALEEQIDRVLKPHADAFMAQIRALPKPTQDDLLLLPPADLVPTMRAMLAAIEQWPTGFYRTELRCALYGNCDLWGVKLEVIMAHASTQPAPSLYLQAIGRAKRHTPT